MSDIFLNKNSKEFIVDVYTIGYDNQGESIYVVINDDKKSFYYDTLIDCYATDCNRSLVLLNELKRPGDGLNCICISHYHDDHVKGMDMIIEKYAKENTKILLPDVENQDSLSELSAKVRLEVSKLRKNGRYKNGSVHKIADPKVIVNNNLIIDRRSFPFEIIAISPFSNITIRNVEKKADEIQQNDYSISLIINIGYVNLLFTGDIMNNSLNQIEQTYELDYIKIPHHGSKDSDKIFNVMGISDCTTCVTTNYKPSNLPNKEILNRYKEKTDEVYVLNCESDDDYGIVHTKYKINIIDKILTYDTDCTENYKKYISENEFES